MKALHPAMPPNLDFAGPQAKQNKEGKKKNERKLLALLSLGFSGIKNELLPPDDNDNTHKIIQELLQFRKMLQLRFENESTNSYKNLYHRGYINQIIFRRILKSRSVVKYTQKENAHEE